MILNKILPKSCKIRHNLGKCQELLGRCQELLGKYTGDLKICCIPGSSHSRKLRLEKCVRYHMLTLYRDQIQPQPSLHKLQYSIYGLLQPPKGTRGENPTTSTEALFKPQMIKETIVLFSGWESPPRAPIWTIGNGPQIEYCDTTNYVEYFICLFCSSPE